MAHDPADRGERLEMLGAGIGRGEQQENQIDRDSVDRLIADRVRKADEQTIDLRQAFDFAVRDGDSLAEAGRAELLALPDRCQDFGRAISSRLPARFASC
jgi:hypothetical protein